MSFYKVGNIHDMTQITDIRLQTRNLVFIQHTTHTFDSELTGSSPYNQLTNHRVIVYRNFVTFVYVTIDTYTDTVRFHQLTDNTRRRHEIVFRILGTDTAFDGMTTLFQIFLLEMKRFIISNAKLFLNQVYTYYFFSNRMFNLQTCIHFKEIEITMLVDQELNCSSSFIIYSFGSSHSSHGCAARNAAAQFTLR